MELQSAWDALPANVRAHPGVKALHRAALGAAAAEREACAAVCDRLIAGRGPFKFAPTVEDCAAEIRARATPPPARTQPHRCA